jgi:glycosyltransferase involved in cell wall biosynthesis
MRCPPLADLPPPPAGKTGWPWTVETPQLPPLRPDGTPWPRISIVTPSYNQGPYIEETIRSILLQGYPDLEYIVVDGASTDGAVDIIRKYAPWLTYWTSRPDDGQLSAINTGMARATGSLLNWINSDDFLLPHALEALGCILALTHSAALISGGRHLKCTQSGVQTVQLLWPTAWPMYVLGFPDFPQDATFFTREIWDACGPLDTRLNYVFDTAFLAKAVREARETILTRFPFSVMQIHPGQKTSTHDERKALEMSILEREYVLTSLQRRIVWRLLRTRLNTVFQHLLGMYLARRSSRFRVAEYNYASLQWQTAELCGPNGQMAN